jgi:hypothetical protein
VNNIGSVLQRKRGIKSDYKTWNTKRASGSSFSIRTLSGLTSTEVKLQGEEFEENKWSYGIARERNTLVFLVDIDRSHG